MITTHELARKLLTMPDVPVAIKDSQLPYLLDAEAVAVEPKAQFYFEDCWETAFTQEQIDKLKMQMQAQEFLGRPNAEERVADAIAAGPKKLRKDAPQKSVVVLG